MKKIIFAASGIIIIVSAIASCSCGTNSSANANSMDSGNENIATAIDTEPITAAEPQAQGAQGIAAAEPETGEIAVAGTATATAGRERIGNLEFDKLVHNFGDVMISDGPLSCTFTVTNKGEKPAVIYNVITSCGCADVKWSKEPLLPGKTATISATYSNDEGPYPFDKTLTVYVSDVTRPVILRLRGISHEKQLSLEEMYPVKLGSGKVGVKTLDLRCGNIVQGGSLSDVATVANFTDSPVGVSFANVSPGLSMSVDPNPIPARGTSRLIYTVKGLPGIWGTNYYHSNPVIGGETAGEEFSVYAFTIEDFSGMTETEKAKAGKPIFAHTNFTAGKVKAGKVINAEYTFSNAGNTDFEIYKIDTETDGVTFEIPGPVKPGTKGVIKVKVDTDGMPKGEMAVQLTLTTNSPVRPIARLYVSALLE